MRPLSLKGHDRALTRVRLNKEGDLLFSAAKDKSPCVWYVENGERLGTYDGHNGVIWDLDVSFDSAHLVTVSGDNSMRTWDVETGRQLSEMTCSGVTRACAFSYSGNLIAFTTTKMTKNNGQLFVVDKRDRDQMVDQGNVVIHAMLETQAAQGLVWSHLDDSVVTGNDNGLLAQYDIRKGDAATRTSFCEAHKFQINDLQMSPDMTCMITSSKDRTARLVDAKTLDVLKTYRTERPVNSAAISPIRDHIILGGGEEAMTVTQSLNAGGFEAKLYHMIFEEEFARVKGHFGPINTLTIHPNGTLFVTGAEDGYVRIQEFDTDYFDFDFDY